VACQEEGWIKKKLKVESRKLKEGEEEEKF
jgi:hypothetical protein